MKNSNNIIFIDISASLFPPRLCLLPNSQTKELSEWNFLRHILNSNADQVMIHLLNELAGINKFELVLVDSWINVEKHKKQYFEELFHHNKINAHLHDSWFLPKENTDKTSLWQIGNWLTKNKNDNYLALVDKNQKNLLDFPNHSTVDYTKTIFVDPTNGLSFENIREVNNSFQLWKNN